MSNFHSFAQLGFQAWRRTENDIVHWNSLVANMQRKRTNVLPLPTNSMLECQVNRAISTSVVEIPSPPAQESILCRGKLQLQENLECVMHFFVSVQLIVLWSQFSPNWLVSEVAACHALQRNAMFSVGQAQTQNGRQKLEKDLASEMFEQRNLLEEEILVESERLLWQSSECDVTFSMCSI